MSCNLCAADGGALVWRGARLRVIRADMPGFPAFYRVVWNAHVAEFSELDAPQRQHCMDAVVLVERALREALAPTKINLAAFGTLVPHLHWHVFARFAWDSHYPAPVWAPATRQRDLAQERALTLALPALDARLARELAAWSLLKQ